MVKRAKPKFKPASRKLRLKDLKPGMVMNWAKANEYYGPAASPEVVLRLDPETADRLWFDVYLWKRVGRRKQLTFYRSRQVWGDDLQHLEIARGPW